MRNLSLGRRHLVNAYEVEAGICVVAGNTVWSMPERLECEVLQKVRYINTLTFTFKQLSSNEVSGVRLNSQRTVTRSIAEFFSSNRLRFDFAAACYCAELFHYAFCCECCPWFSRVRLGLLGAEPRGGFYTQKATFTLSNSVNVRLACAVNQRMSNSQAPTGEMPVLRSGMVWTGMHFLISL